MSEAKFKPKLPEIAEAEQTPLVRSLLQSMVQQQERIEQREEAIRRLKGGPGRPTPGKPGCARVGHGNLGRAAQPAVGRGARALARRQ